jgi:choline dehydrogenase-like flavoprotein
MDATEAPADGQVDGDVCIIGGGPAGLVVARELAERDRDVIVLESGARYTDASAQELNDGDIIGDAYAGTRVTRHRQIGGTIHLWNTPTAGGPGAKYVELDPWDLEPRWADAPDGWPLALESLRAYYARARELCGLSPSSRENGHDAPSLQAHGPLVPRVYDIGAGDALLRPLLDVLQRSPNVRMFPRTTAIALTTGRRDASVTVAGADGVRTRVRARRVVLAAGAIENARLLLTTVAAGGGVADRSGWLGRGFMEHPRDRVLSLVPADDAGFHALAFFDVRSGNGRRVVGRLGLSDALARAAGQLNASVTLLANIRPARVRVREALRRTRATRMLERWLPPDGPGWSRHPSPASVFEDLTVLLNLEQPPHRDNAIVLGRHTDRFGVPVPELHWRWHAEDHRRLQRLREIVAAGLRDAGIGAVKLAPDAAPDPNAHHHAGTTRMHADAAHGVVDAACRVHGTETLFVAGASVFPTAGFANPTLTIVAMALRLADDLCALV